MSVYCGLQSSRRLAKSFPVVFPKFGENPADRSPHLMGLGWSYGCSDAHLGSLNWLPTFPIRLLVAKCSGSDVEPRIQGEFPDLEKNERGVFGR